MMEQDIAGADRLEDVRARGDPRRQARGEAGELQVGAVHQVGDGLGAVEVHRAVDPVQVVGAHAEAGEQELGHVIGALIGDLKAYRIPVVARDQLAFDGAQQVIDLLLVHEQLAVAGDPELMALSDLHAVEQLAHVGMDHGR